MDLHRLAAVATIVGTLIAAWQLFGKPNDFPGVEAKNQLPHQLAERSKSVELSLNLPVYEGDRKWLRAMYDAAMSMPYSSGKSDALSKLVDKALAASDFNMAILAASESPYSSTKDAMLWKVVEKAIEGEESIRYAVAAANKMPYSSSKASALGKIITAFEVFAANEGALRANKEIKPTDSPPLRENKPAT